jgi:hypothetical protein
MKNPLFSPTLSLLRVHQVAAGAVAAFAGTSATAEYRGDEFGLARQ